MATVTTKAEQVRAGRVARRLGGYAELIRLAGERERLGRETGEFRRDEQGRYVTARTPPRAHEPD